MNINDRIDKVTNVYKKIPKAWAVALFGSRATGTATDASDINIMVIESELASQSLRAQILSTLADPEKPSACRDLPIPSDVFHLEGIPVTVWHIPEDLVCERVSTILKNRPLEDSVIVSILHNSRILWDPKKQLLAWKNIVSPLPLEYRRNVIPILFSGAAYGLELMAHQGPATSLFYCHHEQVGIIKMLYEIVFISNNTFLTFSSHLDDQIRSLESVPDDFIRHVEAILSMDITPEGLQTRWRRLCHLVHIVGTFLENQRLYNLKTGWAQLKKTAPFLFNFDD